MGCNDYYPTESERKRDEERYAMMDAGFNTHSSYSPAFVCSKCSTLCEDWRVHLKFCPAKPHYHKREVIG